MKAYMKTSEAAHVLAATCEKSPMWNLSTPMPLPETPAAPNGIGSLFAQQLSTWFHSGTLYTNNQVVVSEMSEEF